MSRPFLIASLAAALIAAGASAHADCYSSNVPFGYTCWTVKTSTIMPSQTWDDGGDQTEYVYVPVLPAAGHKLLLYLPGTGGSPGGATDFMAEAALHGYYVIGLGYRNQVHSPDMCGYWGACYGKYYQQQVDGPDNGFFSGDASASGQVAAYNSITYRFGMVLAWLIDHHGGAVDWNVFWNYANAYAPGPGYWYNGTPMWSHIVIAGHSQGGETATWITKNKDVIAGMTFEAPYATLDDNHSTDDPSDTTVDGPPHHMKQIDGVWTDVTSKYTPWPTSGGTPCNTCFADYLDPSSWPSGHVDRLFITLDSTDGIYPKNNPGLGHWLEGAGAHLGKNETQHVNACPSQLSTRFNTTDYVSSCGGHHATIIDGCTPPWIRCYWDLMLDRALTL